jgi:hypothetical protein
MNYREVTYSDMRNIYPKSFNTVKVGALRALTKNWTGHWQVGLV